MLNLTPHPITIRRPDGSETTFPPSGRVARVATEETVVSVHDGVPVVTRTFGKPEGLPADGQPCLVSALVLSAIQGAKNVFAPDTGATAIRDERGFVVAVTRLVQA